VEGPQGGGQSRHGDDGLRDPAHGRSFKLKLFYTLTQPKQAGLQPGITSAFATTTVNPIAPASRPQPIDPTSGGSFPWRLWPRACGDIVSVKGSSRRSDGLH